jgi:hypothetical protein
MNGDTITVPIMLESAVDADGDRYYRTHDGYDILRVDGGWIVRGPGFTRPWHNARTLRSVAAQIAHARTGAYI